LTEKKIQCFNCNRIGHFSIECVVAPSHIDHRGSQSHSDHEENMAKEENEANLKKQSLMLMMITNSESHNNEIWYIDFRCSNHMTGHRDWLVKFDAKKKSTIRCADNRVIQTEGAGNVLVTRQDGRQTMISDMLYVSGMKSNVITMGQLLEKGFSMNTTNGFLEIYDTTKRMTMKAPFEDSFTSFSYISYVNLLLF